MCFLLRGVATPCTHTLTPLCSTTKQVKEILVEESNVQPVQAPVTVRRFAFASSMSIL